MRKFLLYLLVALLFAPAAFGATTYRYGDNVQTVRGDAISGATVTVYVANTTTKVDLYSGPSTGFAALTNPIYSDGYGRFSFYAVAGTYDIAISGVGITSYTLEDVRIFGQEVPWYDITDYGAIAGDGGDDTSGIQAAIDAAILAGGGKIYFPDGIFRVTGGLTASYDSTSVQQLTFSGNGKHTSRLLLYASGSESLLEIDAWETTSRSFMIENLGFSLASGTGSHAISIKNASRGEVNNCYIYGFTAGAGVRFDAESNKHADLNRVVSTYIGNCQYGVYSDCSGTVSSYCDANMIMGCQLVNNTGYDIYFGNSGGIAGKGNAHFVSDTWVQVLSGQHGLYIDDDVSAVKVSNTNFDGAPADTCITISASSTYNLFSNIAIDGGILDNSGNSEFYSIHFSNTSQDDYGAILATPPLYRPVAEPDTTGNRGLVWFDGTNSQLNFYDGSAWRSLHHGVASYAYGSMYQHDTATSVTFGAANADSTIGGWSSGTLDNFTLGASSRALVAAVDGTYLINWAVSAQAAGTGKNYEFTIAVDGTPDTSGSQHFGITAATSDRTASGTALVALTAGQRVSLVVRNETDTTTLTVDHANLTAVKVD